jgi:phosphopentomutase
MLGYTVRIPYSDNRLLNALKWDARVDVRTWQPTPTLFERATQAGINVSNISASRYESSGFTEAVLRGATFRGANNFDSMRYELKNALKNAPAFVYLYSNEVDVAGHKDGVGSDSWINALSSIDNFVGQLISDLPVGTRLWVTADHGMVNSDQPVILNHLSDEVLLLGGEPRARHIYLHEAAIKDADSRWKDALGDLAQVISKQEAVDTKLFGAATSSQALDRMGDLILIANSDVTLIEPARAVQESAMVGHHGALSDEERLIPFLSHLN